jgi:nucleoside-diphosphate-sugar epimerase
MIGVIGGSGFLGSFILRDLKVSDVPSLCLDIAPPSLDTQFFEFDVTSPSSPDLLDHCDALINLAAVHRDDIKPLSKYYEVNVDGARKVCHTAVSAGVKTIVFTSSVAIYGFAPANTDENGEPNYFNEYGKTKYLAEQVYLEWQAQDPSNRTLVIVRPTVIFGPGNRGNVYNLLRQIASRRFAMFGDGQNVKSMAYVENVAKFLVQCTSEKPGVHIYNYIDKPDLTMNQLVQVTRTKLFGKSGVGLRMPGFLGVTIGVGFDVLAWLIRRPLPISSIRVKKFMATSQFNSSASETGFDAPYTLAEGLERTLQYEFLEDNRDKPTYETE